MHVPYYKNRGKTMESVQLPCNLANSPSLLATSSLAPRSSSLNHVAEKRPRDCHYHILFCVAPHLINCYGFLILALLAVMEQLNPTSVLPAGLNFFEGDRALPAWI
jgi:hypothetical protein